jgi:hypothetical protein
MSPVLPAPEPVVMSRTANVNPLLVLLSLLVGTSIGDWVGGSSGSFARALLAIPGAGALQVITRELWPAAARPQWRTPPRNGRRVPRRCWPFSPQARLAGRRLLAHCPSLHGSALVLGRAAPDAVDLA